MKSFGVPLICLGGGGYTIRNVARTWTYETGLLVGQELDEDLPFNEYMQYFGPEYKLDVPMTSMENQNSREYLEGLQ
jgi:histone deacetylase 1/2